MNFNKMLLEMMGIKFSGFKYVIEIKLEILLKIKYICIIEMK